MGLVTVLFLYAHREKIKGFCLNTASGWISARNPVQDWQCKPKSPVSRNEADVRTSWRISSSVAFTVQAGFEQNQNRIQQAEVCTSWVTGEETASWVCPLPLSPSLQPRRRRDRAQSNRSDVPWEFCTYGSPLL